VENTLKYWSFCQNTADLHLSHEPPMPLQSVWIPQGSLLQMEPKTLPECECEALFFPTEDQKRDTEVTVFLNGFWQMDEMIYSGLNSGAVCPLIEVQ
jgi:hypothetical protein